MEVFKDYAAYYDAFYGDKDYAGEAAIVSSMLKEYGDNVKSILSFGCGTGKHDIELSKLGYSCHGVDLSSDMIKEAQKRGQENTDVSFEVGDIRHYHSDQKYDAVISLFHVISYQNSNEDVTDAFRSAKDALAKGGIFIFDLWYGPGVLTDLPAVRAKEAETDKYRLLRIARPDMHDDTDIVDVNYEVIATDKNTGVSSVLRETHSMRYFFRPELEYYLDQCGFKLICMLDGSGKGETSYSSWTAYCIAVAE